MPWKILPAEIFTLAGLLVCLLLNWVLGLEWYNLDRASFTFAYGHYLGPLAPIFILYTIGALSGRATSSSQGQSVDFLFLFRMAVVFSVVVLLHFNLKLWAPLINRNNFDALYWSMDHNYPWLLNTAQILHGWMPQKLPLMRNPYHDLFVLMFAVSFTLHGTQGRDSIERVMTATVLVLVVGALCYALAPAVGPFIFDPSASFDLAYQQGLMHWFQVAFVQTKGVYYEPSFFMAMPAAMPSLHIANAVVFYLFARRDFQWLGWIYGLLVLYFSVEAVGLKWHYLVDIPAGILLGWLAYRAAILSHHRHEPA